MPAKLVVTFKPGREMEERVGQLRHLLETVDLLYDVFLKRRLSSTWPTERERMQSWMHREEKGRLAATA